MGAARACRALGLAAVLAFMALAFTPLPNWAHRRFVEPGRLEPAQAIVVLGAGGDEGHLSERSLRRAVHGIRLYHQGLAPTLVLHGPLRGPSSPEADTRAELARDLVVPPAAILICGGRTTPEEARQSWDRLAPRGARRIVLVTGADHMPRARRLFERQGFEVVPAPVDEADPRADRPERRLSLARSLLQEGMARLVYRLSGQI